MRPLIAILNRWPQYPDSERWDNSLAKYDDLIPHDRYRVVYVCDPVGRRGVPSNAHDVHLVPDFNDVDAVVGAVRQVIQRHGPVDLLIAFSEYLLDAAAVVRERWGIPGPRPRDVDRVRDKTVMKERLQSAGVRVPRWHACQNIEQVLARAPTLGFPLILKPIRGASSKGVRRIESLQELESICRRDFPARHEIEEFVEGDLLHADGVVDRNGTCVFLVISRYISSCLEFEAGIALGSIIQTDPVVLAEGRQFALRVLAALELRASAFHLEFFDTGPELVFLEIGARVPGADVSYVIHDVYGVNLFRLWIDVLFGRALSPVHQASGTSGGWLMIPRPKPLPQTVVHATSLMGRIPFLYRELVPKPGQILEDAPGYASWQGGRFLFRGGGQAQIVAAVDRARAEYQLRTAPL